jgi:cytochrome c oxidase subunit 3
MSGGYKLVDKSYVSPQFGKTTPGKLAMWMFLMTDAMSFSGFLLGYAVLRTTKDWPNPADHFSLTLAVVMTLILSLSSLTMVLAIDACKQQKREAMLKWLLITIIGGVVFLGFQVYEYGHLIAHGMTLTSMPHGTTLFGSTFYMITGFHGLHVIAGVIYLIAQYKLAHEGRFDKGDYRMLELAGLFWHFVDLVWIFVFTFIYLM